MTVTEGLMTVGRFSIKLDDAPLAMRQAVKLGSNVFITTTHISDPTLDVDALKSVARYSGLIRRVNVGTGAFSGSNLLSYLQTNKGHGGAGHPLGEPSTFPCQFDDVMAAWFDGVYSNGLLEGTNVGHVATSIAELDLAAYLPPFKPALDNLAKQTGNEYVCRHDGTVDYGLNQLLFAFTPTVLIAPGLSGQDGGITALEVDRWDVDQSIENQRNHAAVITSDGTTYSTMRTAPTTTHTTYRFDDTSNACVYYTDGFQTVDSTDSGDTDDAADALAQEFEGIEYFFECSVREYAITRLITPGDWVYVYDPDNGINAGGTSVIFQGRNLYPEKFRCVGVTWPVQKGMGVYVGNDVYGIVDVTDFVRWETGATRLDIDSLPRALQVAFPTSTKYK